MKIKLKKKTNFIKSLPKSLPTVRWPKKIVSKNFRLDRSIRSLNIACQKSAQTDTRPHTFLSNNIYSWETGSRSPNQ